MNGHFITIIVPSYNAEKTIAKCVDSLLMLNYVDYEIIIIDDGSEDKTREILAKYKDRVQIIESEHFGPSKCRNIAVLESKGDFMAFTDSDCIVDKNWLKELMDGFIDKNIAAVGGTQSCPSDDTDFGKMVQLFFELTGFLGGYIKNKNKGEMIKVSHNPSCNAIYRKDVFLRVGGFDEMLWPCEDVDLDYRLKKKGFVFMYNPKAIVYHYRSSSIRELSKMMCRYGVMQGILTRRYGFFRKIQFVPIISVLFIAAVAINPFWLVILFILYVFILIKLKNLRKVNFVVFLCTISFLYWTIGFSGGLIVAKK